MNTDGSTITGDLIVQPKRFTNNDSASWDYATYTATVADAFDGSASSYAYLIPSREVSFVLGTEITDAELGILNSTGNGDSPNYQEYIEFVVKFDVESGSATVRTKYWHPALAESNIGYSPLVASALYSGSSNTQEYYFGNGAGIDVNWSSNKKKAVEGVPWRIEEIKQLQINVQNQGAGAIKIYNCYFRFRNITIYQTSVPITGSIPFSISDMITNASIRNFLKTRPMKKLDKPISYLSNDQIHCYVQGYMYDNWID